MNDTPADKPKPASETAVPPKPDAGTAASPPANPRMPQSATPESISAASRQAGHAIQTALRNLAAQGAQNAAGATPRSAATPAVTPVSDTLARLAAQPQPASPPPSAAPRSGGAPVGAGLTPPASTPPASAPSASAPRAPSLQAPNQAAPAPQNPPSQPARPSPAKPAAAPATGVKPNEPAPANPAPPSAKPATPPAKPVAQPSGLSGAAARAGGAPIAAAKEPATRAARAFSAPQMDPLRMTPRSPRTALEPERVKVPPKRSQRARHPIVMIGNAVFTIILLLALGIGALVFWAKQRFEAPGPLPEEKVVNIRPGGIRDIAETLQREGVINEPWIFIGGALALKARGDDLKYGEYQFPKNASLRDVAETIIAGKVVQHLMTLAEGLTSEQIVARLLENPMLAGNVREIPREGSLLPESYRFERGTTREQIIQRMQQAQARAVKEIWDRRVPDLPIQTPEQFLILASIVEKETGKPDERTRVAAVFHNRLKQKMKLQSDPTIIYGLVGGKGSLGRPIMKSEIEQPTPYNTYVIPGLPPGPIANPGRATLEAVANPARTKELFFVADGTGGHAFADNYDQHQKNVARLRAIEQGRDPNAAAPAQPQAPAFAPTRTPARPLQNTGRSTQAPAAQ